MTIVLMHVGRLALLLAAALVLGACQPSTEPSAVGGAVESESAAATLPHEPASSVVPEPLPVDRTPATDPWLFEGIPNFEDLVSGRDGDWFVVLGAAPRTGVPPRPTIMAAADPGIAAVQQRVWNTGRVPFVVGSEALPAFETGFMVVVLGPFARPQADAQLSAVREVVSDAYLKAGW